MHITHYGNCTYLLSGTESLNSRKLFKLNIFLSTNKSLSVKQENGNIIVSIQENEEKNVFMLDRFLSSLNIEYTADSDYLNKIKNYENAQQEQDSIIQSLIETRAPSLSTSDFQEFQAYCNAHMSITLKEYQFLSAYRLFLGNGGFDFSVPGAGKTVISYAAYSFMQHKNRVKKLFIIGPISAYNAWMDEYKTCFGIDADFISLSNMSMQDCKLYLNSTDAHHHEISFINYEKCRILSREITSYLSTSPTLLIIDEAHKIKSPNAKTTESIRKFAPVAKSRILLTGTPMPNGYEDLVSLMDVYSPNRKIFVNFLNFSIS